MNNEGDMWTWVLNIKDYTFGYGKLKNDTYHISFFQFPEKIHQLQLIRTSHVIWANLSFIHIDRFCLSAQY